MAQLQFVAMSQQPLAVDQQPLTVQPRPVRAANVGDEHQRSLPLDLHVAAGHTLLMRAERGQVDVRLRVAGRTAESPDNDRLDWRQHQLYSVDLQKDWRLCELNGPDFRPQLGVIQSGR